MKAQYAEQQKSIAAEVINIACGYVEPLCLLSDVVAKLDVLTSFAQVSADAPEPYVRPRLLPKGLSVVITIISELCCEGFYVSFHTMIGHFGDDFPSQSLDWCKTYEAKHNYNRKQHKKPLKNHKESC